MISGYRNIGLPPVVIVGGSSLVALVLWSKTYLRRPVDPAVILPVFLLTVAALEVHMIEEYPSPVRATGVYYFPSMYTAILPMIPGIYAIVKLIRVSR